ncbi:MAG: GerMN domain-containing protein [Acidobacteriia bacterium]|nr:GerMN domain-containing protein [Terriglobia bacterium]
MRRHLKSIVVVALLVASGVATYYFRGFARVVSFFRKQTAQSARPFQPSAPLLNQANPQLQVRLFFPSLNNPGRLEEERGEIRASGLDQNRAKQIILKLIEGSTEHRGRTLSQDTVLRELFLTPDGTAIVDFSNAIQTGHPGEIECELQTIFAVTDSLTANIPSIKRVRFLINDSTAETLVGHVDLSQAFTPDMSYVVPATRPASSDIPVPKT